MVLYKIKDGLSVDESISISLSEAEGEDIHEFQEMLGVYFQTFSIYQR